MELIGILIPIIAGNFAMNIYDFIKKHVTWLEQKAPAVLHQILVAASGYGLAKLGILLGIALVGTDITNLAPEDVQKILAGLLTFMFKSHKTQKEIKEGRLS